MIDNGSPLIETRPISFGIGRTIWREAVNSRWLVEVEETSGGKWQGTATHSASARTYVMGLGKEGRFWYPQRGDSVLRTPGHIHRVIRRLLRAFSQERTRRERAEKTVT